MNNNNKKEIVGLAWSKRLHAWCNNLTHKQRVRLLVILSAAYLVLTVVVLVCIYLEQKQKSIEIHHIKPVPMLKKLMMPVSVPIQILSQDSATTNVKEQQNGKK
jgi:hypothetical protein